MLILSSISLISDNLINNKIYVELSFYVNYDLYINKDTRAYRTDGRVEAIYGDITLNLVIFDTTTIKYVSIFICTNLA